MQTSEIRFPGQPEKPQKYFHLKLQFSPWQARHPAEPLLWSHADQAEHHSTTETVHTESRPHCVLEAKFKNESLTRVNQKMYV